MRNQGHRLLRSTSRAATWEPTETRAETHARLSYRVRCQRSIILSRASGQRSPWTCTLTVALSSSARSSRVRSRSADARFSSRRSSRLVLGSARSLASAQAARPVRPGRGWRSCGRCQTLSAGRRRISLIARCCGRLRVKVMTSAISFCGDFGLGVHRLEVTLGRRRITRILGLTVVGNGPWYSGSAAWMLAS
jgi:hypothetical protein